MGEDSDVVCVNVRPKSPHCSQVHSFTLRKWDQISSALF